MTSPFLEVINQPLEEIDGCFRFNLDFNDAALIRTLLVELHGWLPGLDSLNLQVGQKLIRQASRDVE